MLFLPDANPTRPAIRLDTCRGTRPAVFGLNAECFEGCLAHYTYVGRPSSEPEGDSRANDLLGVQLLWRDTVLVQTSSTLTRVARLYVTRLLLTVPASTTARWVLAVDSYIGRESLVCVFDSQRQAQEAGRLALADAP